MGDVTGMYLTVQTPGGGGADSDTDGTDGGYAEIGLTVDGTFYTIKLLVVAVEPQETWWCRRSGGTLLVPAALANDSRFSIVETVGADGDDGGYTGSGFNDALGASGFGGGGNGTAQIKQQTNNDPEQVYTSNGSWQVPAVATMKFLET